MAATNFTPIQLYYSTTASAAPVAGNLENGELAINITDGKLFYKDNGGSVQVLATKGTGTIGGSNNQVQYNSSGALAGSANFTFDGTTATINTLNLTTALDETYGGTGNSSYTTGDLLYASAANTLSKLTVGTNGYILTSNGTIPQWTAGSSISVDTATNLAGGAAGSVPYQSGPGATTFLSIGAANRVLTSSGTAPQWVTSLTGLTGVSSSGLTNTSLTAGRVVYSTTGGAQTDSANLTFNGTTLTAAGLASSGASTLDKLVKIGDTAFTLPAILSATAPGKLYVSTATVTDGSTAAGATNTLGTITSFGSTTVAASNTGVTYTNLATLYIAGAPTAGTNVTITNPYSLYIAAGAAYFGGGLTFAGQLNVTNTTDASSTTTGSIITAGGVGIAKSLWVGYDANIYGITVGRGAGAVSTNTAVGASALAANTTGANQVAVGYQAGVATTTGSDLTAVGYRAAYSNTSGSSNIAVGNYSLYLNTTGVANTVVGYGALLANTVAGNNTAIGYQAGYSNTSNGSNSFFGYQAGYNSTAGDNDAFGSRSLYSTTTGNVNAGFGQNTLYSNTTGSNNTASGVNAAYSNTTGSYNVAVGKDALRSNTTASNNTAVGYQAGFSNQTGAGNVYFGWLAGYSATSSTNTFIGAQAGYNNTTGERNTYIGNSTGFNATTGSNNTFIGLSAISASGAAVTTGSKNTILGGYNGNQGGLDIRTSSNNIVLSDGDGEPRIVYYNAAPLTKISGVLTHNYTDTQSKSQINLYDNTNGNTEIASGFSTADFVVATGGTTGNLAYSARANGYFVTNSGVIALINTTFTVGSNTYTVTASSSEGYVYCTPDPIGEAATGTLTNLKYATEGFRVNDARRARFNSTVGVGNVDGASSGAGITFPATQSASSNANTLDDYERGTFTATIRGSVSDPTTPVTSTAYYTKIGNQVSISIQFESVNLTGASGDATISGLPFTPANTRCIGTIGSYGAASWTGQLIAHISVGQSHVDLLEIVTASAWNQVSWNTGTDKYVWVNATFFV